MITVPPVNSNVAWLSTVRLSALSCDAVPPTNRFVLTPVSCARPSTNKSKLLVFNSTPLDSVSPLSALFDARLTAFDVLKIASSSASGSSAGFQFAVLPPSTQSEFPPIHVRAAPWACSARGSTHGATSATSENKNCLHASRLMAASSVVPNRAPPTHDAKLTAPFGKSQENLAPASNDRGETGHISTLNIPFPHVRRAALRSNRRRT